MRHVEAFEQALPGPAPFTASVAVSGHMALGSDGAGGVKPADPSDPANYQFLGVAIQAAQAGTDVLAVNMGSVVEPGWSWTPFLPVYAGPAGSLTQAIPDSGILHQIGFATSATSIFVQPQNPIVRS